jgi:hypothetical protein
MNCTGNAIELDHSLSSDVRAVSSQFASERRFHQAGPSRFTFCFVSGNWSSTVRALNHYCTAFAAFASPSRFPLLCQVSSSETVSRVRCLNIVASMSAAAQ